MLKFLATNKGRCPLCERFGAAPKYYSLVLCRWLGRIKIAFFLARVFCCQEPGISANCCTPAVASVGGSLPSLSRNSRDQRKVNYALYYVVLSHNSPPCDFLGFVFIFN